MIIEQVRKLIGYVSPEIRAEIEKRILENLKQLYEKGCRDGEQIKIFLEEPKFCINR